MKNLLIIGALLLSFTGFSQTAFSVINPGRTTDITTSDFSVNNSYFGGQFAYNIAGDVSKSFVFDVRMLRVLYSGEKFSIPALVNLGSGNRDVLSTEQGISFGVRPWYILSENKNIQLIAHGGLDFQMPQLNDVGIDNQFKMLVGLQAAIYSNESNAPTLLNVNPAWVKNLDSGNSTFGLEFDAIVPVATRMGIVFGASVPFDNTSASFNLGVMFNDVIK